ncbi:MAG: DEAD/DEAH box helicase [Faecalimonas umbilicata]|uniref:DEAD/DEAH box helicase n=1 Tax=Faecalimonas umbilicata TaxID=1912855 RepID=UPI0039958CA8
MLLERSIRRIKASGDCSCPQELAIQVAEEIRNLAKYMHGIKVLPIYGGQEIVKQIRSLKSGTQLVIGTPTCDGSYVQNYENGSCAYD